MDPSGISSHCNVKTCSFCPGDTEYYCHICQQDMCRQCKEEHVINLDTLHHNVTIYRQKYNHPLKKETCFSHRKCYYSKYCKTCEVPVCDSCSKHSPRRIPLLDCFLPTETSGHKCIDIKSAYQKRLKQYQQPIFNIRSYIIYNCSALLAGIYTDISYFSETCHNEIDHRSTDIAEHCEKPILRESLLLNIISEAIKEGPSLSSRLNTAVCIENKIRPTKISEWQYGMEKKGQKLNEIIDTLTGMPVDGTEFKESCLKQMIKMVEYIARIRNYEDKYEQNASRSVQFLRFLKTAPFPQIQDTPYLSHHKIVLLHPEINMRNLIQLLVKDEIHQRGKRQERNDPLFKLMPSPVLQKSFEVSNVKAIDHMSCVTPYRVWVSNDYGKKIILKDTTTNKTLYRLTDSCLQKGGSHTVNSKGELFYIDINYNIKKLCSDMKTKTIFLQREDYEWILLSIYCSPSSGDFLVGKHCARNNKGKVNRFNSSGQLIQTILKECFYSYPHYVTENKNGDVVVSDRGKYSVIVTGHGGSHRFTYKTNSPKAEAFFNNFCYYDMLTPPYGICTDPLLNILVCVDKNVHIIDKDGHFLSYLVDSFSAFELLKGLTYDFNCHLLWVGSLEGNLSIYNHISRHKALTYSSN